MWYYLQKLHSLGLCSGALGLPGVTPVAQRLTGDAEALGGLGQLETIDSCVELSLRGRLAPANQYLIVPCTVVPASPLR